MELHVPNNPSCKLSCFVGKQCLSQQPSCLSKSYRRSYCRRRLQIVSRKARSDPEHTDSQPEDTESSSALPSSYRQVRDACVARDTARAVHVSVRACDSLKSQELQEQRTHVGIAPDSPQAPKSPRLTRWLGFGLGLAAFSAILLGAFSFQRRRQEKQQRQNSPAPAPGWQSQPPVKVQRSPIQRPPRTRQRTTPREPPRSRKEIICRNFAATGKCRFGDRCRYRHELIPQGEQHTAHMRSGAPQTTEDTSDSANDSDSDDSSASVLARPRRSARQASSSESKDQQARKKTPSRLQTLHEVYTVPADQVRCP